MLEYGSMISAGDGPETYSQRPLFEGLIAVKSIVNKQCMCSGTAI